MRAPAGDGRNVRIDRDALRRLSQTDDVRAAIEVATTWASIAAAVALAAASGHWGVVLAAMVFIGSRQNALAALAHEAWHGTLFSDRALNHRVGAWLCAYPIGIPYTHDRERHLRHHREVGIRSDPDWPNYTREGRETPARVAGYLASLLAGRVAVETAVALLLRREPRTAGAGGDSPAGAGVAREYACALACQAGLFAAGAALVGAWAHPLLWLGSLATFAAAFTSTRALLEHLAESDDAHPRTRLRDFDAGPIERLLLSPFHFHLHALHHLHPSIPHRNLPRARGVLAARARGYPLPTEPGYLRALARWLRAIPVMPSEDASTVEAPAGESKPAFEARQPHERVIATCDACGGSDVVPVTGPLRDVESAEHLPPAFRTLEFGFGRCARCGLVYLRERPCADDLDVFYGDAYKCYESYAARGRIMSALARLVARRKLAWIDGLLGPREPGAPAPRLLDYGCGSGSWLELMRALGCEHTLLGMDVTPGPIEDLRGRGIDAWCCDEQTMFDHVEPGSIDVIHLFHVIEHLPQPARVLEQLHRALRPGGVLIGQTPNVRSTACRIFGDHWNQWHVPRHLVLFDHETLGRHAEHAGFEVERIASSFSGATQWALSGLAWWAAWSGRPFRSTHEPLYPPLILACLPIAAAEAALAHTCHMDFALRKPR